MVKVSNSLYLCVFFEVLYFCVNECLMVLLLKYCVLLLLSPLVLAYHMLRFLFLFDLGSAAMSTLQGSSFIMLHSWHL